MWASGSICLMLGARNTEGVSPALMELSVLRKAILSKFLGAGVLG